jgi:replication-associated recombination protein RarA
MEILTKRGYDFFLVTSAMQKAIRRGDAKIAGYFALELFHSNYISYLWKRLFTISAEDCYGVITKEIDALYNGFKLVNDKNDKKEPKGRIFISKAVILLCEAKKNRDADHLQNLVYDKKISISDSEINDYLKECESDKKLDVPKYAYDCHTIAGKMSGKTKTNFLKDELKSLNPREIGLFDDLVESL